MSKQEETCFICDQPTGRAGIHDDSLYAKDGTGPHCEECWDIVSKGFRAKGGALVCGFDKCALGVPVEEMKKLKANILKQECNRANRLKVSACYFPAKGEAECTWEDAQGGKMIMIVFPVTEEQGLLLSEIVAPCVYHPAAVREEGTSE